MKTAFVAGIVLIVFGIVSLAYQGFTYKTRKPLVDIGPIHATETKTHNIPLPPLLGALALVAGVVLVAVGAKQ